MTALTILKSFLELQLPQPPTYQPIPLAIQPQVPQSPTTIFPIPPTGAPQIPLLPDFGSLVFWAVIVLVSLIVAIVFLRSRGRATGEAEIGEYQFHLVRGKKTLLFGGYVTRADEFISDFNLDMLETSDDPEVVQAVITFRKYINRYHYAYGVAQRTLESGVRKHAKRALVLSTLPIEDYAYYDQMRKSFRISGLSWVSERWVICTQESEYCGEADDWDLYFIDPLKLERPEEPVKEVKPSANVSGENTLTITEKTLLLQAVRFIPMAAKNVIEINKYKAHIATVEKHYQGAINDLKATVGQLKFALRILASKNPWGDFLLGLVRPTINPFVLSFATLLGTLLGGYILPLYEPTITPFVGGLIIGSAVLLGMYLYMGGSVQSEERRR